MGSNMDSAMNNGDDALRALLEESRIPVRPGFRARVMAALPVAAWERRLGERRLPAWALPGLLAASLALGAALVLAWGGASVADSHAVGITVAVVDFLGTTALAGAGLLHATWRGFGLGLAEIFADSPLSLVALAAMVVFLDLLVLSLLRRRKAVPQAADEPPSANLPAP